MTLRINGNRLWESLVTLAEIGGTPQGGVSRVALSEEDRRARDLLREWAASSIDETHIDEAGNIFLIRSGNEPQAPLLLTGSHLDTQLHGGRFDGAYGVMAGLEVLRTLAEQQQRLPYGVALVCWTNEEEARYCPAMGSAVFVGKQTPESAWACVGNDGSVFGERLRQIGYAGTSRTLPLQAYFEVHIEQGPVLEQESLSIGVVEGAQGQIAFDVLIRGEAGHSGTVPMRLRHDAMACATEAIQACHQLVLAEGKGVFTVGAFALEPNSRTTIPGEVCFGVDLRHPEAAQLVTLRQQLEAQVRTIAAAHGCSLEVTPLFHKEPVVFHADCITSVQAATEQLGYPFRRMASGAFHDACLLAEVTPTGMIFVPSQQGISHNPLEYTAPEELERGANVLLHALLRHAETPLRHNG